MKNLYILFLLVSSFTLFAQTHKVIGIIDGDTYDVLIENRSVRIRMDAIDAPERGMPYNKKAKKYLSDMIFGKFVRVVEHKKDRNGRSVSQTFLTNGTNVSAAMIKAGFAWHYTQFSDDKKLANLELEARNARRGLWADPHPYEPWEIRKLHRNGVSTKVLFENSIK
jgi:micrococcal nuclease